MKAYFESDGVVDDYAKASVELGLWASEEKIFTRLFAPDDSLLELGCGAGRIAIGLYELGYRNLLATDYIKLKNSSATLSNVSFPLKKSLEKP